MYRNGTAAEHTPHPQQPPRHQNNYVVEHDFDGTADLTTTLIHAIADVTGVDVTDTGFTLNDHVDPDALNHLFAPKEDGSPRANGNVSFAIWGHQVTVYSHGLIVIVPPSNAPPAPH